MRVGTIRSKLRRWLPAVFTRDMTKCVFTEGPLNTNVVWWNITGVKVQMDGAAIWFTVSALKYQVSI